MARNARSIERTCRAPAPSVRLGAVDLPVLPVGKCTGSGRLPGSGAGFSQHRVDGQIDSQLATLMTQQWSFDERKKGVAAYATYL